MPRFCLPFSSVSHLMFVVPDVDTTGLALEVRERLDVRRLLRDVAVGRHEVGVGEADLLLAIEVVGRRAALEVDRAVGHQRDARRRRDRVAARP